MNIIRIIIAFLISLPFLNRPEPCTLMSISLSDQLVIGDSLITDNYSDTIISHSARYISDSARNSDEIIDYPFVVYLLYLTDKYIQKISQNPVSDQERVLVSLAPEISKRKSELQDSLVQYAKDLLGEGNSDTVDFSSPLKHYNFGDGVGHIDALDLFTDEGSSVMAPIHSVVILAESTWRPNDVSSSVSDRGGNTVVLFDGQHFIRLAHLNTVGVVAGQVIAVGDMIGTVGHTGSNASLLGHGHHLHIEIHLLQNGTITQLSSAEIKQVLSEGKLK